MKTTKKAVLLLLVFACVMAVGAQSVKEATGDAPVYYTRVISVDSKQNAYLALSPEVLKKDGFVYDKDTFIVDGLEYRYTDLKTTDSQILHDNGITLGLFAVNGGAFNEGDIVVLNPAEVEAAAVEKAGKAGTMSAGGYLIYGYQEAASGDNDVISSDYGLGLGAYFKYRQSEHFAVGLSADATGFSYKDSEYEKGYWALDIMTQFAFVMPVTDAPVQLNFAADAGLEIALYDGDAKVNKVFGGEFFAEYFFEDVPLSITGGLKIHSTAESVFTQDDSFGVAIKPYIGAGYEF